MKYAIIGLGLAALVMGCDGVRLNSGQDSPAIPSSSANQSTMTLTCDADGGVASLTMSQEGFDPAAYQTIPDWAAKTCGPIRKATYPPSEPSGAAAPMNCPQHCTQANGQQVCSCDSIGGTVSPGDNPYDHMGENGRPG